MQVTEENGTLDFSSVGGLNHPQFSNMDFDADGMNDFWCLIKQEINCPTS